MSRLENRLWGYIVFYQEFGIQIGITQPHFDHIFCLADVFDRVLIGCKCRQNLYLHAPVGKSVCSTFINPCPAE